MSDQTQPDQRRSRRALLVIGGVALLAIAGPWIWRSWQEAHLTDGMDRVYAKSSARSSVDLAMCLLKRRPEGLTLEISSENHFVDPARGVVVELSGHNGRRGVEAWVAKGNRIAPGEVGHLDSCLIGDPLPAGPA